MKRERESRIIAPPSILQQSDRACIRESKPWSCVSCLYTSRAIAADSLFLDCTADSTDMSSVLWSVAVCASRCSSRLGQYRIPSEEFCVGYLGSSSKGSWCCLVRTNPVKRYSRIIASQFLMITGCPGGSGVSKVLRQGSAFQRIVDAVSGPEGSTKDRYFDVIGSDPRGINHTTPHLEYYSNSPLETHMVTTIHGALESSTSSLDTQ